MNVLYPVKFFTSSKISSYIVYILSISHIQLRESVLVTHNYVKAYLFKEKNNILKWHMNKIACYLVLLLYCDV
jgi:hypothetical protein